MKMHFKILFWTLVVCLTFSTGSVMAEQDQPSINRDQPSATRYEVQDGKLTKEFIDYLDGSKEIITYSYDADGTVEKSTTIVPSEHPFLPEGNVSMQVEPEDVYIYDQRIKDNLNALTTAYGMAEAEYQNGTRTLSEKNSIQNELHFQADLARADYIIMNPNSTYAKIKLGGSSKSFPLSRNLSYLKYS